MRNLNRRAAIALIGRAAATAPLIAQTGGGEAAERELADQLYGTANPLNAASLPDMAHASAFGARFDGTTDDSAALQRAVDAAAARGQMLILPSGTALLSRPLDLRYRNLAIRGQVMDGTKLRAARPMAALIDAAAERDQIISPLILSDFSLEGAGLATTCLSLAHRHHSVLANLYITGAKIGVLERATWLSRRSNCRVSDHQVGWRLAGENNSSHWQGCTFTNCTDTHLDIGSDAGGNVALLFENCDVEFGGGAGVSVTAGAEAAFSSCYLGEGLGGDTLRNAGLTRVSGGAFFFGGTRAVRGLRSLPGGDARFSGVQLNGGEFGGLAQLLEAADPTRPGRVVFTDVKAALQAGGNPIARGDLIGAATLRNFVSRLGRDWVATATNAEIVDRIDPVFPNSRTVACRTAAGRGALFGLAGRLTGTDWREGEPLMLLIAYSASRPVHVRLSRGAHGAAPVREIGTLPPSPVPATYIKIDVPAQRDAFQYLEIFTDGVPGATVTLHRATLADNGFLGSIQGNAFSNLAHAR